MPVTARNSAAWLCRCSTSAERCQTISRVGRRIGPVESRCWPGADRIGRRAGDSRRAAPSKFPSSRPGWSRTAPPSMVTSFWRFLLIVEATLNLRGVAHASSCHAGRPRLAARNAGPARRSRTKRRALDQSPNSTQLFAVPLLQLHRRPPGDDWSAGVHFKPAVKTGISRSRRSFACFIDVLAREITIALLQHLQNVLLKP